MKTKEQQESFQIIMNCDLIKKLTKNSLSLKIQFTHTLKRPGFSPYHFNFRVNIRRSTN